LLILLDEPFTGIDPITIADIRQIVLALRNHGIGILLTDHNVREALKITDRSYLIKDGKVRTHGSPRQILHDPIAINEYLGQGFHDDIIDGPPARDSLPTIHPMPAASKPAPQPAAKPAKPAKPRVVKAAAPAKSKVTPDVVIALVEALKGDKREEAADHLLQLSDAAIPGLLQALERRDVELRRQAHEVLQVLCKGPIAFDPYAPESMRRQQLAKLRQRWERKAG
jgi:lipopolysaccharide export system ATP-binding protein